MGKIVIISGSRNKCKNCGSYNLKEVTLQNDQVIKDISDINMRTSGVCEDCNHIDVYTTIRYDVRQKL